MCLMCDPAAIHQYVTAGNATFTLTSMKTEARYTYKAQAVRDREDRFFVSLLTGADNTASYSYIGLIDRGVFRLTGKSKLPATAAPVRAIDFFCRHVLVGGRVPAEAGLEVRHMNKCGRCNRALTVPESIDRGIGPECWEKMGLAA